MHGNGPQSSFGILGRRLKNLIVAEELGQSLPTLQRYMSTIWTLTQIERCSKYLGIYADLMAS